jgi:hypothetical protein
MEAGKRSTGDDRPSYAWFENFLNAPEPGKPLIGIRTCERPRRGEGDLPAVPHNHLSFAQAGHLSSLELHSREIFTRSELHSLLDTAASLILFPSVLLPALI